MRTKGKTSKTPHLVPFNIIRGGKQHSVHYGTDVHGVPACRPAKTYEAVRYTNEPVDCKMCINWKSRQ
jgi:hypothetical protein